MVCEILKFDEYKAAGGNGSYDIPERIKWFTYFIPPST